MQAALTFGNGWAILLPETLPMHHRKINARLMKLALYNEQVRKRNVRRTIANLFMTA
jgi:hypothetical protein